MHLFCSHLMFQAQILGATENHISAGGPHAEYISANEMHA